MEPQLYLWNDRRGQKLIFGESVQVY